MTGRDNVRYPQSGDRKVPGYTFVKDLHLYLYVNLFFDPWSDSALEKRIRLIYESWDPASFDWGDWNDALSTIKAVYVENEYSDRAIERLQKLFAIEKIVSCENGKALRVDMKTALHDSRSF